MLPLLAARDLAAPLAWRAGVPVSAALFLGQAQALADSLPAQGRPINLCQDRYHFALGLVATLLRGQTSLMPPNALPDTLRALGLADGGAQAAYALVDPGATAPGGLDLGGLPAITVQALAEAAPAQQVPELPVSLEAVRLLTSGSTGAPQPHAKRWGPLVANIGAEAACLAGFLNQPSLAGLNIVATVPPQHSYGFESTVLLALLGGASFDAGRPFYPADIAAALASVPRPRALVTTPFHLKTLLLAGVPLPPVDLLLSATAPLSPQLAAQAEAAMGGTLVEIYGCTEAGQVAARRTTAGETWQALGALRLWREEGPDGETFLVQGGHVEQPTPLADVLVLESAQRFRLLGRANDLIHVAGKRSSLAHLNFHLNRVPGVEDGAFWMPEEAPDGIARPIAFVVAPTLTARQLVLALREHLEAVFVPRRVVFVPALPREATGKLTAGALARFARETLAAQGLSPQGEPLANGSAALASAPVAAQPANVFDIPASHPAFPGHFPGQPVLPGVVLLGFVMQALAAEPELAALLGPTPQFDQVKFLQPLPPGSRVQVLLKAQGRGVAFDVQRIDGTHAAAPSTAARGQLSAVAGATPAA